MYYGACRANEVSAMQNPQFTHRVFQLAWILFVSLVSANAQASGVIRDVRLTDSGTLQGVVVAASNASVADSVVQIHYQGKIVAAAKTAADGRFAIGQVRPGMHEIVTASSRTPVRIWASGTAPAGCQGQLTLASQPPSLTQQIPTGVCGGCVPANSCVPCQTCEPNSAFGLVDAISLATVGSSIAALVIAIDANRTADAASNATAVAGAGTTATNGQTTGTGDTTGVASP